MTLDLPDGDFDGYIFDCDGTLVDSMPLHHRAWKASLEHHEAPYDFDEQVFYGLAGVPDVEIVNRLNREHGCDLDGHSVHEWKKEWFGRHMHELEAVHAVAEIVRELHPDHPIAVASGSDRAIVEPELEIVGLRTFFEVIITPADVERGKPEPDMFLLAAERLGVNPARCLVFEDGQAGLDAAAAAGMQAVFVPSAPHHRHA